MYEVDWLYKEGRVGFDYRTNIKSKDRRLNVRLKDKRYFRRNAD
jgi:hypothetical protein